MEQENETNQAATVDIAGKLAEATQAMAEALHNINAQFDALHTKIDRIVAAVEEGDIQAGAADASLRQKLASAEKANEDLKAQAAQARRKTLSPMVTTRLAKQGSHSLDGIALSPTELGPPALQDAHAVFECRAEAVHDAGDHAILIGRVVRFSRHEDNAPLVYYRGKYGSLAQA